VKNRIPLWLAVAITVVVSREAFVKNRIPLWLAVAITVVVSLPFGLWLDAWSLPLWAAFIVWAEYFLLGGKPEGLKIMVPSYILGVIGAVLVLILAVALSEGHRHEARREQPRP